MIENSTRRAIFNEILGISDHNFCNIFVKILKILLELDKLIRDI